MSGPVIALDGVVRTVGTGDGAVRALDGVTLQVSAGGLVAVVGPSGSGKTTLLNVVLGLDRPDNGAVEVLGTRLDQLDDDARGAWRRAHTAIAFQIDGLLDHLTAEENVDLVLRLRGVPRNERRERARSTLDRLGLADHRTHLATELSGGQRQRVALARALACDAPLLVADEPTAQLDADTAELVLTAFREAAEDGATVLVTTHDPLVRTRADRSVTLVDGRLDNPGTTP